MCSALFWDPDNDDRDAFIMTIGILTGISVGFLLSILMMLI